MKQDAYENRLQELEDAWEYELTHVDRYEFISTYDLLIDFWIDANHKQIEAMGEAFDVLTEEQKLSLADTWSDTDAGKKRILDSKFLRQKYAEEMIDNEN
jgi:hypothetical protein